MLLNSFKGGGGGGLVIAFKNFKAHWGKKFQIKQQDRFSLLRWWCLAETDRISHVRDAVIAFCSAGALSMNCTEYNHTVLLYTWEVSSHYFCLHDLASLVGGGGGGEKRKSKFNDQSCLCVKGDNLIRTNAQKPMLVSFSQSPLSVLLFLPSTPPLPSSFFLSHCS